MDYDLFKKRNNNYRMEFFFSINLASANFKESEIAQLTDKFLAEEKEFCDDFLSKLNKKIDDLEDEIQKQVS